MWQESVDGVDESHDVGVKNPAPRSLPAYTIIAAFVYTYIHLVHVHVCTDVHLIS